MRLIDANKLKAIIIEGYRKEFFGSVLWNIIDDMPTITIEDYEQEDYEQALEWLKKISKYGEYRNGNRNWSDNANKFIPFLENAIEKAIRYDNLRRKNNEGVYK